MIDHDLEPDPETMESAPTTKGGRGHGARHRRFYEKENEIDIAKEIGSFLGTTATDWTFFKCNREAKGVWQEGEIEGVKHKSVTEISYFEAKDKLNEDTDVKMEGKSKDHVHGINETNMPKDETIYSSKIYQICPECGDDFYNKSDMQNHQIEHHQIKTRKPTSKKAKRKSVADMITASVERISEKN